MRELKFTSHFKSLSAQSFQLLGCDNRGGHLRPTMTKYDIEGGGQKYRFFDLVTYFLNGSKGDTTLKYG